jgi:hypothetical protein
VIGEALYYQAAIHKLDAPDMFDIKDIQTFMSNDVMGLPLNGPNMHTWGVISKPDSHCDDGLVALRPRQHTDTFSSKLTERLIDIMVFLRRTFKGRRKITLWSVTATLRFSRLLSGSRA